MTDPNETTIDRLERRKNPADMVNRSDFNEFRQCVAGYRKDARESMAKLNDRLDDQDDTLTRQNTILTKIDGALFNEDDGLVYIRNWMCRMAKFGLWVVSGALTLATGIAAILGSLGYKIF